MSNSLGSARFTTGRPGRTARRPRRWSLIMLTVFALLILLGGVEVLVLGVFRMQDAANLAAAPVCASAQQARCRLHERVTVIDFYVEQAGKGGSANVIKVRTPDGSPQFVYADDYDSGLWSRLRVNEQLNAELWNGNVISMDDGAGHSLLDDGNPTKTALLFPLIGVGGLVAGGGLLALCVRTFRRPTFA